MSQITSSEKNALCLILDFIEDYDACCIKSYKETVEHSNAINKEQYYSSDRIDMYCVKLNTRGYPLNICLKNIGDESMEINIYPKNVDGTRIINFNYNYYESDCSGEWYEKKPYWYADFSLLLYETEEEYFQASTITDLVLTPEENKMFVDFYNEFMNNLNNRIKGKYNG